MGAWISRCLNKLHLQRRSKEPSTFPSADHSQEADPTRARENGSPDSTPKSNVYKPLPPGRFFRYLVLQPASKDDDRLVCTLETSELGGVDFEAISYVWGSNVKDKTIICNGQGLAITNSLHHVLVHLRRPAGPRTLWADAICIDQSNLTEKGHQVCFMSEIYPKARRVLVHLGPTVVPRELGWIVGAPHPRRAKALIEEIDTMVLEIINKLGPDAAMGSFPWPSEDEEKGYLADDRWLSLDAIFRHPWFERGWVVQEAGLARECAVLCGDVEFGYVAMLRCRAWYLRRLPKVREHFNQNGTIHDRIFLALQKRDARVLNIHVQYVREDTAMKTLEILEYVRNLGLGDDRDRVFAFLALLHHECQDAIVIPDYTKASWQVYWEFATKYIGRSETLDILHNISHSSSSVADTSIPSWVPRWNIPQVGLETVDEDDPVLGSKGEEGKPNPIVKVVSGDQRTLSVRGVLVDKIRTISERLVDLAPETVARLWKTIEKSCSPDQGGSRSVFATSQALEVFLKILGMGRMQGSVEQWRQGTLEYMDRVQEKIPWEAEAQRHEQHPPWEMVHSFINKSCSGRRFVVTERGYFALVPGETMKGDVCAVVFGTKSPFVLRPEKVQDRFLVVGDMWMAGKQLAVNRLHGGVKAFILGSKESKDWVYLGLEEQDIHLC